MTKNKLSRGKLIVLDGTDGAGKTTQLHFLVRRLKKEGRRVAVQDFPRYGQKSAGLVEEYLDGRYGNIRKLGPYVPSIFYAADRFAASSAIRDYLRRGYVVICNRYVTANMGHQGAKIKNARERREFFRWLTRLEYGLFNIPQPDLHIFLYMPPAVAQKLAAKKWQSGRGVRRDVHETDLAHLRAAARIFREVARLLKQPLIDCAPRGHIRKPGEIAEDVYAIVKESI